MSYTVEITNLSPNASKKEIYDFFGFCGAILHVKIVREGELACKAYVTFKNPHAVDTAVLLNGSTILDQAVSITECRYYKVEDEGCARIIPPAGNKAVSLAQEVVKTVAEKGKDAMGKAKAFDESRRVSAKVLEVSQVIGLTDKISTGVETVRSIDQRYDISGTTKSAFGATQRTAISAANAVVSSSYFCKGALWVSGVLDRASRAAADLSKSGISK